MNTEAIWSRRLWDDELKTGAKIVPEVLTRHILPFDWDVEKVWALDCDVAVSERADFDFLLELPLWSSRQGAGLLFDLRPIDVLENPGPWPHHEERLQNAGLDYPLDFLSCSGNTFLLDGSHRLAKAKQSREKRVKIRIHDESVIPVIRIEKR